MRDLALLVTVLSLVPFIVARPNVGILAWAWLTFMSPQRLAYGFAHTFPFAQIVALATLVGLMADKEKKRVPWTPITVTLVLFTLWTSVTTVFSLAPEYAVEAWQQFVKMQIMVFLTLLLMQTRERIHWLVWVIAFSIAFYGVKGGLFAFATGGAYRILGPPNTFIGGNNEIAFALCVILPLLRFLLLRNTRRIVGYGLVITMVLVGVAILASYSRGAFVAASAMLLVMLIRSRRRGPLLLTLLLAIPLLINFMPEQWAERMHTIDNYQQDGSMQGRFNAWGFALNLSKDYPITGGGFRAFQPDLFVEYAPDPLDYHDSHSIYFEVLGEQGFVGLGLFLLLIVLTFRSTARTRHRTRGDPERQWAFDLASMLDVSMVGYLVGGIVIGLAFFDLLYYLMALAVLTQTVVERESAERGPLGYPASGGVVYGARRLKAPDEQSQCREEL